MKSTTIILITSLVILSVLCTVLAYLWIDRSITLAYVNASVDSEIRTRIIITDLIESEWRGKSLNEIHQKPSTEVQKHPEKNIVLNKTEKTIEFDELSFFFDNNRLKKLSNRQRNAYILFF
ncbi:Imm58 family immunity protein [Hafnia alvei]|uniref:Imm58 family immunity protein n=1 Tax=Hafnia alvei TaxID=569 RepID=UPI000DF89822|nr:Imm58 family immunity protein [Hafnia alvei]STQ74320.1 Uncharacterised protein [Hafnia alvei]